MVLGGFVWFAVLVATHDVYFSEMCTVLSVFESHLVYRPKYMGLQNSLYLKYQWECKVGMFNTDFL